jgi:hypothetical protein
MKQEEAHCSMVKCKENARRPPQSCRHSQCLLPLRLAWQHQGGVAPATAAPRQAYEAGDWDKKREAEDQAGADLHNGIKPPINSSANRPEEYALLTDAKGKAVFLVSPPSWWLE